MAGFVTEFKDFIARGNVMDLAIGVIIGAAFGKIVTSLVDDLIMPGIGMVAGKVDFKDMKIILQPAGADPNVNPEVAIRYGNFINNVLQFLIVAFCIFLIVKAINRISPKPEPVPTGPTEVDLLVEIRDSLKKA